MTNWPDKSIIRIIRGEISGNPITNKIATRTEKGNFAVANSLCVNNYDGDSISEWEEVTAVPTARLEELKKAWHGDGEYTPAGLKTLGDAMDPVLSFLPDDEPGALDRAVTDAKNIGARGILEDFTLNDRISLLLAAVRDTHTGEDLRYRLAWVARLAYTWADLEDPSQDALEEISEHAARILTEGRVNQIDVANLTCWVGDIAAAASGEQSPRPSLIVLGARALAWAAEIIEEEGR